ncbi:MAG: GatB/YqeY domain-containing protein [Candidatus Susulua stagnicola]|nr:GatB/YqeY domain-containing protein [Candidatus Susulua stagnicola]
MLENKIYQDYTQALRDKNRQKIDFLSLIRSDIKNQAISLRKNKLEDTEVLSVLKKAQKKLQDAKESIVKAERTDLLEDIEKELIILSEYLPKPLAENELIEIIDTTINKISASSIKDMGQVMKEVLAKTGVRADSKTVSNLVKTKLST